MNSLSLLDVIKNGEYPEDFLMKIAAKTTDFSGCLAASFNPCAYIWSSTRYKKSYTDEFITMLCLNTKNFEGCLEIALFDPYVSEEIIDFLFKNTKDFSGCVSGVFRNPKCSVENAKYVLENTPSIKDRLFAAVDVGPCVSHEKLDMAFEFVKDDGPDVPDTAHRYYNTSKHGEHVVDYSTCLKRSLDFGIGSNEFRFNLAKKATNFDGALYNALGCPGCSPELIDFLFERTTNFRNCLCSALERRVHPDELIERLIEKAPSFNLCLAYALKNGGYSLNILEKLLQKTDNFSYCRQYAKETRGVIPPEFLEKIEKMW